MPTVTRVVPSTLARLVELERFSTSRASKVVVFAAASRRIRRRAASATRNKATRNKATRTGSVSPSTRPRIGRSVRIVERRPTAVSHLRCAP